VFSAVADDALLNAMTTTDIAPVDNPIFHLMMTHLNTVMSSHIYPV
jgi:hypothetical protein